MTDLGADVVNFVSHAAQQRLQSLLENVSQVAQQKNVSFKVCQQLQHLLKLDNTNKLVMHRSCTSLRFLIYLITFLNIFNYGNLIAFKFQCQKI